MIQSEESLAIRDIYETLAEDPANTVTITFPTKAQALAFCVRLYRSKSKSEKLQVGCGFIDEEQVQSLCVKKNQLEDGSLELTFYSKPKPKTTFTVIINRPNAKTE